LFRRDEAGEPTEDAEDSFGINSFLRIVGTAIISFR
jgi:hypothetical protein